MSWKPSRDEERAWTSDAAVRICRPRVERALARAAGSAVTVLVGAAGCGKSDALRAQLEGSPAIVFRVGNARRTFARFVHGLAQAVSTVAPGAAASFPRAWERSLQSRSPSVSLAHWLCEHLEGSDQTIAIDDLHDTAGDANIASFIAKCVELRPDARFTIAARSVGALPIALWMATRQMQRPIQEQDLRFTATEVAQAAERLGAPLTSEVSRTLLDATNGFPVAVMYALTLLRDEPVTFLADGIPASFEGIAAAIFARRSAEEQDFLLTSALMPTIEDDVLRLCGWPEPEALRVAMGSDARFMSERCELGERRFNDRFDDFLIRRLQAREPAFRSQSARRVVDALSTAGQHAAALEVATRQQMTQTIGNLLDAHGFEILESGEVDSIGEALHAVDESTLGSTGFALRAYIEARSGHLDTAEAWFRLSLENAREDVSRATAAMYYSRELTKRHRPDACEVLEPLTSSTSLPPQLLIDVRSSFARALTVTSRLDEARLHADESLALLDATSPPALRARVFERAAFVAFVRGDYELARARALVAAPLAVASSLYEVASSAFAVLYNLAYDIDDDVELVTKHLRSQCDTAAKCGILRADLFGVLGMYELSTEAADETALAELEVRLANLDKHDATLCIAEALIPAKALQAGWAGQFDAAQRLLRPTAEHQATAVRRALCWAQVAMYCAAAGDSGAADRSAGAARTALGQLEHHERRTTQYGLTLLSLALAAFVGDNCELAREWTDAANDAVIGHARRLCALRAAIRAMIDAAGDAARLVQGVPRTLAALRAVSFGGMAKLIEALPFRCSNAAAIEPIGRILAQAELAERFAVAVECGSGASLRKWLDADPHSTFENAVITTRFEHWVALNGTFCSRTQSAIWNVRRELATYRRRMPVTVGHVDDIDAALEELFEQLDRSSPLMAEHSRAVAAWCSRLGRTLGLSEPEITFVSRCGLIHDIGKIHTPAEILDAPRKLTPAEWVIMRAHTTDGSVIVERVPILSAFVPIVRGHHERLDGKGYPDGVPGNAIPLAARIVAVADCFNAMIGRRAYRPAMPPTEALNELERHCGTQFDPEVVEAMVQIVLGRLVEPPLQAAEQPATRASVQ
jgi:putative nucleotidyltransferase with HDIG domain